MKHLTFELYAMAWKNKVLVDGEPLQYVTDLKIHVDPSDHSTRVMIEYFPMLPKSAEEQPITLEGYLVDQGDAAINVVIGRAIKDALSTAPQTLLMREIASREELLDWVKRVDEWVSELRFKANLMLSEGER